MKKRTFMSLLPVLALSLSIVGFGAYETFAAENNTKFIDMPQDWSTQALERAVKNGLLSGYQENGQKYIKANRNLTRAEMAAIINNAFNSMGEASLVGIMDLPEGQWYTSHMAKAIEMESFARASKMRPNDCITREEAFTVIAKVFKLSEVTEYTKLNEFEDADRVSEYAKSRIEILLEEGYISGSNGKIYPQKPMTRAEFAAIMDNLVGMYISASESTASSGATEVSKGNILINSGLSRFSDMTIQGDLIIAEGATGVLLENTQVTGRIIIRTAGLKYNGEYHPVLCTLKNSNVNEIVASTGKQQTWVYTDKSSAVNTAKVTNDTILTGNFKNVIAYGNRFSLEDTRSISTRYLYYNLIPSNSLGNKLVRNIENILIPAGTKDAKVSVRGFVGTIDTDAEGTVVENIGDVKNVIVRADNCQINTKNTTIEIMEIIKGTTSGNQDLTAGTDLISSADAPYQTTGGSMGLQKKYVEPFIEKLEKTGIQITRDEPEIIDGQHVFVLTCANWPENLDTEALLKGIQYGIYPAKYPSEEKEGMPATSYWVQRGMSDDIYYKLIFTGDPAPACRYDFIKLDKGPYGKDESIVISSGGSIEFEPERSSISTAIGIFAGWYEMSDGKFIENAQKYMPGPVSGNKTFGEYWVYDTMLAAIKMQSPSVEYTILPPRASDLPIDTNWTVISVAKASKNLTYGELLYGRYADAYRVLALFEDEACTIPLDVDQKLKNGTIYGKIINELSIELMQGASPYVEYQIKAR